jgi:hypothetical protein
MNLYQRLRGRWWQYQRNMDLNYLWPACKEQADTIEQAKAVFAMHALRDACWIKFYGKEGLLDFIDRLE